MDLHYLGEPNFPGVGHRHGVAKSSRVNWVWSADRVVVGMRTAPCRHRQARGRLEYSGDFVNTSYLPATPEKLRARYFGHKGRVFTSFHADQ